jgi:molybdenum cofactor cytidylyltransferase
MTGMEALFAPPPGHWGLRGDPLLWDALRRLFDGMAMPDDLDTLNHALDTGFAELTGAALAGAPDHLRVSWTRGTQGGMSNGLVSPAFWRDTGFPLIRSRWAALQ